MKYQPVASSPTTSITSALLQMAVVITGVSIPSDTRPRMVPMQPASAYSENSTSGSSAVAWLIRPWNPASVSLSPPLIDT